MSLTDKQIMDEIVAIRVRPTLGTLDTTIRGDGVAFWCDVKGIKKLVTAAHLAWPRPMPKPANELLHVEWATKTAAGNGEALFTPHTPDAYPDFAEIEFIDWNNNPPSGLVFSLGGMPISGDQVACVGFPGPFGSPPVGACARGQVTKVVNGSLSHEAAVDGAAEHGYSGGPVFLVTSGVFQDHVIGLMTGAPELEGAPPDANGRCPHDPNKWVFFEAVSFK